MFKKQTFILILGDALVLILALWLTLIFRYLDIPSSKRFLMHLYPFILIFFVWIIIFYIAGLYSRQIILRKIDFLPRLFKTQLLASMIAALFFYLTPFFAITPKTNLFLNLLVSFILIALWRKFAYAFFGIKGENILLVAEGREAEELSRELIWHPFYGFSVKVSISPRDFEERFATNGAEKFWEFMKSNKTSLAVIDFSALKSSRNGNLFYHSLFKGAAFINLKEFYESIFLKIPPSLLGADWRSLNITGARRRSYEILKRWLDIFVSTLFLIPAAMLFLFIPLAIKIESPGPAFFRQKRVGRGGKIFELLKFRSSYRTSVEKSVGWEKEPPAVYTKFGKFMRANYLDEIPQIINILKGEMSFVGPRPERPEFVEELTKQIPFYEARLLVEPGLTGWAQIHMENDAAAKDAAEKLQYDLYYIKNCSLFLDLRILLKTIATILSRSGR